MRKKGRPSCWGPGCSGNDRQQAWHRARPSGQGRCPSPPHTRPPSADATCERNEKILRLAKLGRAGIFQMRYIPVDLVSVIGFYYYFFSTE